MMCHPRVRGGKTKKKKKTSPAPPIMRFATERHSLTLSQKSDYHLSVAHLPPSLNSRKGAEKVARAKKEPTQKSEEENADTCLAHSCVFWEDLPIPYQVGFEVVNCGKTVPISKRRVQFKFGYARRGISEHHELIATWSFTSGKHTITLNGKEIFCSSDDDGDDFSTFKSKLQYSFIDEVGHILEVNVHATVERPNPDWRQYDLLIDGTSFFHLPKCSQLENDDENNICQRHQYQESSMEVFAIMKTPSTSTENNDNANKEQHKSSSDNNSLTTRGSHSISEAGNKDATGGDVTDQKSSSVDAAVAGSSAKNEADIKSPNYYLMVKSRVFLQQILHLEKKDQPMHDQSSGDGVLESDQGDKIKVTSRMGSAVEAIPLDVRPMSVHVTELHIASTGAKGQSSSCSAIGIFVASVDDNILRLYVSTKQALQRRITEHEARDIPCFVSVPLNDVVSASGSQDIPMADESTSEPLVFSTPIMAMDTCVTNDECPLSLPRDQEKSFGKLNRLAIACYDGTVRILTYQLKSQKQDGGGNGSALQFCHLRCSAFIVDGPVVSLHFGLVTDQTPSLFLVAGSLCGFACVFYESSLPSSYESSQGSTARFFDGPLTIVDGLYDAHREGYEDCVTSTHVCCRAEDRQIIVVGTQGGRVLLFQQCQNYRIAKKLSLDQAITVQREKDELRSQIDQNRKEISQLQSEKEEMDIKAGDLNGIISEMQGKIEDLASKSPTADTESFELNAPSEKDDTTNSILETKDEVSLDECAMVVGKEEEIEPPNSNAPVSIDAPTTSNEKFQTKLNMAQTELVPLEQKISSHASRIAESTSAMDDLIQRSNAQRTNKRGEGSVHAVDMRKLHRYEFLWEYHLPYPIHGIASARRSGSDRQEIFVSTRRSLHVFQQFPTVLNSLRIDDAAALTEEKAAKLLAT